jgi:Tol biopolymer transport system component
MLDSLFRHDRHRRADGMRQPELISDQFNVAKRVWSPDGQFLALGRTGVGRDESSPDIFVMRPGADSAAIPLVATRELWEKAPAISTDGRWLACSSNETGRHEILARPRFNHAPMG